MSHGTSHRNKGCPIAMGPPTVSSRDIPYPQGTSHGYGTAHGIAMGLPINMGHPTGVPWDIPLGVGPPTLFMGQPTGNTTKWDIPLHFGRSHIFFCVGCPTNIIILGCPTHFPRDIPQYYSCGTSHSSNFVGHPTHFLFNSVGHPTALFMWDVPLWYLIVGHPIT